jgi:ribosomal protein S18 acetylase RimI-like enzyme
MMQIDTMTICDYDDVYSLWTHTPGMGMNTLDDSREGIEKYLKRNPTTCFVARENGELVGAILSGHDGRRGFIYHAAVAQTKRKMGIGKQLVEKTINALKIEGIHKIAFFIFKKNEGGNKFWQKLGFEEQPDLTFRAKVIGNREMKRIEV